MEVGGTNVPEGQERRQGVSHFTIRSPGVMGSIKSPKENLDFHDENDSQNGHSKKSLGHTYL